MSHCNKILFNKFTKNTDKIKNELIFKNLQKKNNLLVYINNLNSVPSTDK